MDIDASAQQLSSFTHTSQPEPDMLRNPGVESLTVVFQENIYLILFFKNAEIDLRCRCMFKNVVDPFLHDAEDGDGNFEANGGHLVGVAHIMKVELQL